MLIARIADIDSEALQTFVLGVHIIDLNLHVEAAAGGLRLVTAGVKDQVGVAESKAGDILLVGVQFPPEGFAIEFPATRKI
jgi:hypothetical protein